MLITFTCKAYQNITMFGDIALTLIKLMGHSGTVPSALDAAEVPAALVKLQHVLQKSPTAAEQTNEEHENPISLNHRALPLINMLTAAEKQNTSVTWHEGF